MKLVLLFASIVSVSLRRSLANRANLIFEGLVSVTSVAAGLVVVSVIFTQTETLGTWTVSETIVLLGTYHVASGVLWTFIEPNVAWFRNQITEGKLDDALLKPVSSLFLTSLGGCAPLGVVQIVVGFAVVVVSYLNTTSVPVMSHVMAWIVLMIVSVLLIWSSRVFLACLSFWAPAFQPEVLYQAAWQFGRYPVTIYPPTVRIALTYVLPIAFITTLPAQALTQGISPWWLVTGVVAGVGSVPIVNAVWNAGLRRYTSATS